MKWAPESSDDEPDLTPMIDIVFLLIVFFMTVANIVTARRVEIDVPVAEEAAIPESQENRESVTIAVDGTVYLGATEIALDDLKAVVAEGVLRSPGYQVLLRVDATTPYSFTREVMAACASVGATNIIFATHQSEN